MTILNTQRVTRAIDVVGFVLVAVFACFFAGVTGYLFRFAMTHFDLREAVPFLKGPVFLIAVAMASINTALAWIAGRSLLRKWRRAAPK